MFAGITYFELSIPIGQPKERQALNSDRQEQVHSYQSVNLS